MALHPVEKNGQFVKDTNTRFRIKPDDFERNYTPVSYPNVTYLLYEIHWGKSPKTWKNWCKSEGNCHAEINFIENDCKEIKSRRNKSCSVTWFLSWSPCHDCSQSIIKFLEEQPHVTLDIRVSRLFEDSDEENKTGLRNLVGRGIPVSIMHLGDYRYCWRTFVIHQRKQGKDQGKDDMDFFKKICDWNEKLCSILESGYGSDGHPLDGNQ